MAHKYIEALLDNIKTQLSDINPDMAHICVDITIYISKVPESKSHLTFQDLYQTVSNRESVDEDDFYEAVFFLIRRLQILEQKHEALNPKLGRYERVPDEQEIIEAISERDFFNPFTGQSLTLEEFSEQVLPYFSPSTSFIRAVNA
ncbi:hypothetical protein [Alkanindiges illinoisensis]|uniref:Uncharacterized protein n=1 Tax=Alkanindiges illinoisensis TaxID=197183 RepID=A0A4Y7X8R4_9GAMM|nr:hypothetical protein [Alkanindiges illinoisensis]TEU23330.1 hypothetical protein E2B99_13495 [Alkanindiges illinoisensis]